MSNGSPTNDQKSVLPFYPADLDQGSQEWWGMTVKAISRETHPFLASIKSEPVAELPTAPPADSDDASPLYASLETTGQLSRGPEDAFEFDLEKIRSEVWTMGVEMGDQLERQVFEHIGNVAEKYDQTVDAAGRDFREAFIETMEKIDFTFDEHGNHNVSIMMHPDLYEKLKDKQLTPEQQSRLDAIVAKKKELWDESRRRRPLP